MRTRRVRKSKVADWRFLGPLVLVMLVVNGGIIYYGVRMQPAPPRQSANSDPTPPYFVSAATVQPLPKTDKPSSFTNRFVAAAYSAANEMPEVLAQQPVIATANVADIAVCWIALQASTPPTATSAYARRSSLSKNTSWANQQNTFAPRLWTVRGSRFK